MGSNSKIDGCINLTKCECGASKKTQAPTMAEEKTAATLTMDDDNDGDTANDDNKTTRVATRTMRR